jgi:hypothetical protein
MIENNRITKKGIDYITSLKIPIRLSLLTKTGFPVVVSLWYIYNDGKIFCATINSAKIVEYIKHNNKCGFEIARDSPPYKGIRGFGTIELDNDIGGDILKKLLTRYGIRDDSNLSKFLLSRIEEEVAVIIKPEKLFSWDFTNRMRDAF